MEDKHRQSPDYEVVPDHFAKKLVKPRRRDVSWEPVIGALLLGKTLYISDTQLSEGSLKYLRLALSSRQAVKGLPRYKLNTQREYRDDSSGRLLWVEPWPTVEATPVQAEIQGAPVE